jgi:TPR repeat protein
VLRTAIVFSQVLGLLILLPQTIESGTVSRTATEAVDTDMNDFRIGMDFYHKQQFAQALKYFRHAANQGDSQAILQIGLMYDFGKGVTQNYPEALRWYVRAADKGEPRAMYLVGHMYEFGEGVPVDTDLAIHWYLKSANKGHVSAQFEVGKLLTRSNIGSQRYIEGVDWLKLAAKQCHSQAVEFLQNVISEPDAASLCAGG